MGRERFDKLLRGEITAAEYVDDLRQKALAHTCDRHGYCKRHPSCRYGRRRSALSPESNPEGQ